jgi:hypothetical protein
MWVIFFVILKIRFTYVFVIFKLQILLYIYYMISLYNDILRK